MQRRKLTTMFVLLAIVAGIVSAGHDRRAAAAGNLQASSGGRVFLPIIRQPYSFTLKTPDPIIVNPQLDNTRAVSMAVPTSGSTLSATAVDGTRFTLTIPANALLAQERITMTPLTNISGLPFGGGFAAGVDLKPHGLRLFGAAVLKIELASPVPPEQETTFGYRNTRMYGTSAELYLHPLQRGTRDVVFNLLHFSGYGIARGTDAERDAQQQQAPTTYEEQLQQQVHELIRQERQAVLTGQPGDPEFASKLTSLMRDFYNKIVQPILGPAQTDCGYAERYFHMAVSWMRQLQILGMSGDPYDGAFDAEEQAIHDAWSKSYFNCLKNATEPCINRSWSAQMARINGYIRQLQLMGLPADDPRFNLDRYPQCTCGQVANVQGWTGKITFSYDKTGSGDGKTITTKHLGSVTVDYVKASSTSSHTRWDAVSMTGTGQINDSYSRPPHDNRTLQGDGPVLPAGITQDSPGGSIGFFGTACSYEFYLKTAMTATHTAFGETSTVGAWLGMMDVNDIPIQTTGTTLSGSMSVPALWLVEGRDVPSWFSPYSGWVSDLENILGEGNIGDARITWSFTPKQ